MHINKGMTLAQCLAERISYAKNPEKTRGTELVSSYACDPKTVDSEFSLSKRQYKIFTGKEELNEVIAYQVRQSFKPGEVTPEEANQIGYEFATRFLKGNHAFIVCTHVDKQHIHNHIVWNSTTLDCRRKFRDFLGSGRAVARLSDLVCIEHQLSVIKNPQRGGTSYHKWHGFKAKASHREQLRMAIDHALDQHPTDFENFLAFLKEACVLTDEDGEITLKRNGWKNEIRMSSLGVGYSEEDIRAIIKGTKSHTPKKRWADLDDSRPKGIIDIQAKLAAGKGEGYRRWATVENLKRLAKTKLYMDENNLSYEEMSDRKIILTAKEQELAMTVSQAQSRLAEINVLKTHIVNYYKTRDVYIQYRKSGYSRKFLAEHEPEITIHRSAKKAFDELNIKKIPSVKELQIEFSSLLSEKKEAYAALSRTRDELRDLSIHKANYEELLKLDADERKNEKEHGR